jgi:proline racemase
VPTRIRTVDAHVAGQPVRLIVSGLRPIQGTTLAEQQAWAMRRLGRVRRALMHEPRGHRDMTGALLTPSTTETAQAGVLFMDHDGWRPLSLHGLMAVTTIALERGLITVADEVTTLTFDTAGGVVPVRVERRWSKAVAGAGGASTVRVSRAIVRGLPSFVLYPAATVKLGGRALKVDVAFGGAFFAIVDGEAAGVPLVRERLAELRALTRRIVDAVEQQHAIVHPQQTSVSGLAGVIFTSPANDETADLRALVVHADGSVDRSPGGAATAAVMAVVDAMLQLDPDRAFVQEGPIGTRFRGRVVERVDLGGVPAIVPEIEGQAWITGDHAFVLQADDPLRHGLSF